MNSLCPRRILHEINPISNLMKYSLICDDCAVTFTLINPFANSCPFARFQSAPLPPSQQNRKQSTDFNMFAKMATKSKRMKCFAATLSAIGNDIPTDHPFIHSIRNKSKLQRKKYFCRLNSSSKLQNYVNFK